MFRHTTGPDLSIKSIASTYPRDCSVWVRAKNQGLVPPYNCRMDAIGRILAIDFGSRRMGLAVSDPLGITAQGIETMERKNKRADFAFLQEIIRQYQVGEIVLGLPLKLSGERGTQAEKVTQFAEELQQKFHLPVHLWDERLTSAQANRVLREAELSIQKRAQAVDRMAAVLILQSFLEKRVAETREGLCY